jgi:hypothetical protein
MIASIDEVYRVEQKYSINISIMKYFLTENVLIPSSKRRII